MRHCTFTRLNLVRGIVKVVIALGLGVLGVGFLQAGFTFGWAFFPLAGSQSLIVAFYAWSVLKYRRRTIRCAMRCVEEVPDEGSCPTTE